MKVSVKCNELEKISDTISSKLSDIDVIINDFEKNIDNIKQAWKGTDSDAFLEESKKYINKSREDNNYFIEMINSLNKINQEYKKVNEEFLNEVKKESIE